MKKTPRNTLQSLGTVKILLGVLALVVMSFTSKAQAQSSVQFEVAESSRLLMASLDLQNGDISQVAYELIQTAETCKNPSTRLQSRNRPWVMVWNTSDDVDAITSVTIDMQRPGFEFGNGDAPGDGFDGFLSMLSSRSDDGVSLVSANYGDSASQLVLNFSGLTKGQAAIFRVDIDEPAGDMMFPDYDEALFGADVGNGNGPVANFNTSFSSGITSVSTFPQAGLLMTSGVTEPYHAQTMSTVTQSIPGVPEPTSLVLALAGIVGVAAARRMR